MNIICIHHDVFDLFAHYLSIKRNIEERIQWHVRNYTYFVERKYEIMLNMSLNLKSFI